MLSIEIRTVLYKTVSCAKPLKFGWLSMDVASKELRTRFFHMLELHFASGYDRACKWGKLFGALREQLPKSAFDTDRLDFFNGHSSMPFGVLYAALKTFVNPIQ